MFHDALACCFCVAFPDRQALTLATAVDIFDVFVFEDRRQVMDVAPVAVFGWFRNADVVTYLPAIREVIARGGYIIRLGDSSMRPLPKEKGIVDYALSNAKSEFMDLFLCSTCKFFIGTNSGLGLVPPIFGVLTDE